MWDIIWQVLNFMVVMWNMDEWTWRNRWNAKVLFTNICGITNSWSVKQFPPLSKICLSCFISSSVNKKLLRVSKVLSLSKKTADNENAAAQRHVWEDKMFQHEIKQTLLSRFSYRNLTVLTLSDDPPPWRSCCVSSTPPTGFFTQWQINSEARSSFMFLSAK